MKNNTIGILVLFAAIILVVVFAVSLNSPAHTVVPPAPIPPVSVAQSPKDITISVDGEQITLTNGVFERPLAPGSAAKESFRIFGEPVIGDMNGDGIPDAVMYLTRDGGGSGTFFSVVVAVGSGASYVGTNALFLGDRIAPQNITITDGNAVANFAERKPGEAFSVSPSVGKSVWVHLDPKSNQISELVKDFEGEADPAQMKLTMKSWEWIETDRIDGSKVVPKKAGVFSLTMKADGTFSAKTDCNGIGGEYHRSGAILTFGKMMSTMMYCDGSQEGEFSAMIAATTGYHFTSKGELILEQKDKKESAILR